MSKFKRFTFRGKRYIEHDVAGNTLHFYPNRMALLEEARDLSAPVAKAVSVLFADESKDNSSAVKRHHEGEFYMEDITTDAITVEMAEHRQSERDKAIDQILSSLADARSLILLGRLFMDSLREEFEYKRNRPAQEVEEFLYGEEGEEWNGLDAPDLIQLFSGWMKANSKVFGDVGEKMVGLVRERMGQLQNSNSETTEPTSGASSKIPMSPQLATDSEPTS